MFQWTILTELQKIHQLSDLPDHLTLHFLDLISLFKDKDYLNTDGVHPNVSGVKTYCEKLSVVSLIMIFRVRLHL